MGKVRARITSNMDTFYAVNVLVSEKVFLDSSAYILSLKVIKNQFIHEFIVRLYKIADPIRKTTDPENGPQLNA